MGAWLTDKGIVRSFSVLFLGQEISFGVLPLLVEYAVGVLSFGVKFGFGFLLRRLAVNVGVDKVSDAALFEFHGGAFNFNVLLKFGISGFGFPLGLDVGEGDAHIELRLCRREFGICIGFLGLSLSLEDGGFGVDFADFLFRFAAFLSFTNLTFHTGFGDIDFSFVGGALVGLTAQEFEVFAACSVLQFFDVGIVNLETCLDFESVLQITSFWKEDIFSRSPESKNSVVERIRATHRTGQAPFERSQ